MPLPLMILLVIFGLIIFIGIPMGMLWQQWQNRKKADGTYAAGVIVDRTGTSGRIVLMPKKKEHLIDSEKTIVNPEGKPQSYFASAGHLINVLWPPQRSKFFQNSMPFGLWVEGHDRALDLLGEFRREKEAGKIMPLDSSELVGDLVNEKVTQEVVNFADSVAELRKQVEDALNRGRGTQFIMLFIGGITILGIIVVAVVLATKMGHLNSNITHIKDELQQILGTPTAK